MHKVILCVATLLLPACGPSYAQSAKSPDEIVEEQAAIEAQQEKEHGTRGENVTAEETDVEKERKFDSRQVEFELKRAQRSAETCPGVVGAGPYGEVKISLTFNNDGHVEADKSTINEPFAGKPVGECVLRAMNAVIVPAYTGAPVTKDWKLTLTAPETK